MKRLLKYFLRGLTAILPPVATVYILWWLGTTAESALGRALRLVLPAEAYFPGLGLAVGVAILIAVGALAHGWFAALVARGFEGLVRRTPVVKSIYGALKDVTSFFRQDEREDTQSVVALSIGGARAIGFVTREAAGGLLGVESDALVAVYVPMAYQIGGFMLLVPRDGLTPLDMSTEDALRLVLTAGVRSSSEGG